MPNRNHDGGRVDERPGPNLAAFGWDDAWQPQVARDVTVARVTSVREQMSEVIMESGPELVWNSRPSERLQAAVGDWVVLSQDRYERIQPKQTASRSRRPPTDRAPGAARRAIVTILPRRSALQRHLTASDDDDRTAAANVDLVLVLVPLVPPTRDVAALRHLALAVESRADVCLVLTKRDLHGTAAVERDRVTSVVAPFTKIALVSALTGEGLEELSLAPRLTVAVIGPSGGGKSTLINRFLGAELQPTRSLGRGGIGRHTTTNNQLRRLPGGSLLIDTPGMHNLGSTIARTTVDALFPDVAVLALDCSFPRCSHTTEPACAVRDAVDTGVLPLARLTLYAGVSATRSARPPRRRPRGRR